MKTNLRFLPYSDGRYAVSETAEVFDNGKKIELITDGFSKKVRLEWLNELKLYDLGFLVAAAFDIIRYDASLYSRIDIVYKDGNRNNCFPGNITYVFNGEPIPSEVNGFYKIPGFPTYVLSKDGTLLNIKTGKIKTWSEMKGDDERNRSPGYKYTVLYENGASKMQYQHRLLVLVFKKFQGVFNTLTVNHKNGIKKDNDLDNLEWVTFSDNLKHAWDNKLRFKKPRVMMKNLITGIVKSFRSTRECSDFLGDNNGFYVKQRLNDTSGKVYPDFLVFKRDDGKDWPEISSTEIPNFRDNHLSIVGRNVFTGDIITFNNAHEAEQILEIKSAVILDHCRFNKILPYHGYNFRFLINCENWPIFTLRHLDIFKESPKHPRDGILVFDKNTNIETFYTSPKKCSESLSINIQTLKCLAVNGRMYQKRYLFKYFKLKGNLQESISSEASREI